MTTDVDSPSRRVVHHTVALLVFSAATIAWLWPILTNPNVAVPGPSAGDNLSFVWDVWWARRALSTGVSPFWCPALFVPFGVSLVLHTHTLLPAAVAALFTRPTTFILATNMIVWGHVFLNLAIAYALAYRSSGNIVGSALAAAVFGWSPYIDAHLLGHFNLIAGWVLPLDVLLTLKVLEDNGRRWPALLGLALAGTVYTDYYYAIYAILIVLTLAVLRSASVMRRPDRVTRTRRGTLAALATLCGAALISALLIRITGGTALRLGSVTLSARSPGNSIAAAAIICFLGIAIRVVPMVGVRVARRELFQSARRLAPAAVVAMVCIAPLAIAGARLWLNGDYASQPYSWHSAPAGIDIGAFVLGNPRGVLWGGLPVRILDGFHINDIEQVAWISPGVVLLSLSAWRLRLGASEEIVRWSAIGALFLLWALGPYLVAFGQRLPIPLPAILIRYAPIVANARIPARAMVVVYLSLAMLTVHGFAALRRAGRRGFAFTLGAIVVVDLLPARPPIFRVDHPAIYSALRARPEQGAVCELPMGLRDGFGVTGIFDSRVLWHQTIHERGLVGGFVARLPSRMVPAYQAAPVLGSFLRLSSGQSLKQETSPAADFAAHALLSQGIRFVIVDRSTASADLIEYVARLRLRWLAADGTRELWMVDR